MGEHRDLLLVAGHTADRKGQHLRVLDVSDPTNIRSVMGARVGADPAATISELAWSAPRVAYLERAIGAAVMLCSHPCPYVGYS